MTARTMESLIREAITDHMMTYNIMFSDDQHGFVPGRSCISQLLTVLDDWSKSLVLREIIDVLYTDFSKAFDSVPHARLFVKLNNYGIRGKVLGWIKSILTGRRQRVGVDGSVSGWANVTSGIPQGSVLGPLLFVIFINDMPSVISSTCKLFTDDAKTYRCIKVPGQAAILQQDLNKLVAWSKTWQLPFNAKKCVCLHLGYRNPCHVYVMEGIELEKVTEEKDLGVIIDQNLKFHRQRAAAVKKANRNLATIRRSFAVLNISSLPLLFKAVVRPLLEYGNIIWGPHFKLDEQALKKVQRRATKPSPDLMDLCYVDRLKLVKVLKLPSLQFTEGKGET